MSAGGERLVDVLLPRDLGPLTYRLPPAMGDSPPRGARIRVPFRTGFLWGIVWGNPVAAPTGCSIRDATETDSEGLLNPAQIELISWTSSYYLRSPGLVLRAMCPPGLIEGRRTRTPRIMQSVPPPSQPHTLSSAQQCALEAIRATEEKTVLLFGVTGSGKTEIYLQAISRLGSGRGALVLVPEISLTAQTADRFLGRFGDQVVVLHSGLSDGERLRAWRRLRAGDAHIALGTRSAVFSPVPRLGLIIVDEEHSSSYKQEEGLRYHARDLAVVRGMIEKATVVLGSATPSLESFHNAKTGRYCLARLDTRVHERPLPGVRLLDIRGRTTETSPVSDELVGAIARETDAGNQAVVLLNRRGYAPYFLCSDCGHHWKCPQCSITLTFHKRRNRLRCHYCGSTSYPPSRCPSCGGTQNKPLGVGTEKLEETFQSYFDNRNGNRIEVRRMDADTTRKKLAHSRIIHAMEQGEAQLLLGTQMVAKGHDLPGITIGGIVAADDALNLPDFRAPEKAFQLFHQFAGRAGRGGRPGTVYIETREPEHPIYGYLIANDYEGFYEDEVRNRQELGYPPFGRLVRIIVSARRQSELDDVLSRLESFANNNRTTPVDVLGPAPCPLARVRGRFRHHVLLKAPKREDLRPVLRHLLEHIGHPKGVRIDIDVDPIQMM